MWVCCCSFLSPTADQSAQAHRVTVKMLRHPDHSDSCTPWVWHRPSRYCMTCLRNAFLTPQRHYYCWNVPYPLTKTQNWKPNRVCVLCFQKHTSYTKWHLLLERTLYLTYDKNMKTLNPQTFSMRCMRTFRLGIYDPEIQCINGCVDIRKYLYKKSTRRTNIIDDPVSVNLLLLLWSHFHLRSKVPIQTNYHSDGISNRISRGRKGVEWVGNCGCYNENVILWRQPVCLLNHVRTSDQMRL